MMNCIDPKHLFYKVHTDGTKYDIKILSSVRYEKLEKYQYARTAVERRMIKASQAFEPPVLQFRQIKEGYTRENATVVACGRCKSCIINRACEWAMRAVHEASCYDDSVFLTFTYDNDHLPEDKSLNKREMQLFFKRLRKYVSKSDSTKRIKYMYTGEYGDLNQRPHFHALVFGLDFKDKQLYSHKRGHNYYTSETLQRLWSDDAGLSTKGICIIGDVNYASAAYVARYCSKKAFGNTALEKYGEKVDQVTGEVKFARMPEFLQCSQGIGRLWFKKYWRTDLFPRDECNFNGFTKKPPRYYLKLLKKDDPMMYQSVIDKRIEWLKANPPKITVGNLQARIKAYEDKFAMLKRELSTVAYS